MGFGGLSSETELKLDGETKPHHTADLSRRIESAVCDGCLCHSEDTSLHLDGLLAEIPVHYGVGHDKPCCGEHVSRNSLLVNGCPSSGNRQEVNAASFRVYYYDYRWVSQQFQNSIQSDEIVKQIINGILLPAFLLRRLGRTFCLAF